jgi:hypothetical protein
MIRTIKLRTDGTLDFIGDEGRELVAGPATKTRASHVLPVSRGKRWAFRLLRAAFADTSRVASWCRTWRGLWRVEVIGGPTFGPFDDRLAAIRAEVEYLRRNRE